MQSFISMKIKSFSIPVGIALFLCFIGIGFYVGEAIGLGDNLAYFFPNSLLIVGMSSNQSEILKISEYIKILLSAILFTVFFTLLSTRRVKKMRKY